MSEYGSAQPLEMTCHRPGSWTIEGWRVKSLGRGVWRGTFPGEEDLLGSFQQVKDQIREWVKES
jgi:hypothetical protein